MDEQWLPVPGFETYSVSDLGRVRGPRGKILKAGIGTQGYLQVVLSWKGKRRNFSVHTLVAMAFHGPKPDGMEVRHLNGDQVDNRASNVKWGTKVENMQDRLLHGNNPNTNKKQCKRGHSYSEHGFVRGGSRYCRLCVREQNRNYYYRTK